MKKCIHKTKEQLNSTNGDLDMRAILLISSSVFISGCTLMPVYEQTNSPVVMTENDLNYFQIDCKHKKEQIELLQGQKRTKTEIINSIYAMPFNGFQQPLTKRRNWLIDQHLLTLRNQCYSKEYYE
jgi:hypothetical protein